ncbi:Uncharacterised protein [Serratia quinivorans]|nr:Uncharacterised protein [Serratia quinivorans]CAI0736308.1 Uncharacterised protein [Serratia quinivorans]CAI0757987.1 Uncharacterised protein [Serratia quinivorans]CAI1666494.1 Uncharacterised protein [Serratia quinivorans]CAI2050842.1 Uncharacterised protein [Serratia quinivorans]
MGYTASGRKQGGNTRYVEWMQQKSYRTIIE